MARTVKLNNGYDFPTIGLGTWKAEPGEAKRVVQDAIDAGYRHFDCAMFYANEAEIGAAIHAKIKAGVVTREELFITNKLWNTFHRPALVVPNCKKTLEAMGLDYLDLYLVHWPIAFKEGGSLMPVDASGKLQTVNMDFIETWREMEVCVAQGLTRSVGVSNFNTEQLARVLKHAKLKPVVNQVECHPYLTQKKLLRFCTDHGIVITAYGPLGATNAAPPELQGPGGAPAVLQDPHIKKLAEKYGHTAAQVILRYLIQVGVVPIPKSSNPTRLRENFNVYDFELSAADVASIDALNRNHRAYPFLSVKEDVNFPFNIE